jgi:hypothetical protein
MIAEEVSKAFVENVVSIYGQPKLILFDYFPNFSRVTFRKKSAIYLTYATDARNIRKDSPKLDKMC